MVRCIPGSGGVGDFYEDDENEDGNNDNDNNNDDNNDDDVDHNNDDNDEDNLVFLGNNQPWSDAFLEEGGWVISTMMTTIRMSTMTMWTTIPMLTIRTTIMMTT